MALYWESRTINPLVLISLVINYCACLSFPPIIHDAFESADYFQFANVRTAWAQVRLCKQRPESERFLISNCNGPFNFKSLIQQTNTWKGVFFELDMEVSKHIDPILNIIPQYDQKGNFYGQKVAEGPGCKGRLAGPLKIIPELGTVALMFNEKYINHTLVPHVAYQKDEIEEMMKVASANHDHLNYNKSFIVLNLQYLSKTDLGLLKLFKGLPILLYKFEQQTGINMHMAQIAVDWLKELNSQVLCMLPKELCLALESEIPSADWRFWRADPRLRLNTLPQFYNFIIGPRKLIELQTRECSFSFAISWQFCTVLFDYLTNLMIDEEFVTLFECPQNVGCRGLGEVRMKQDRPFMLAKIVNGPNWNGSAVDYLGNKFSKFNVNLVIGFREKLGLEKAYTKKHIGDLIATMNQAKFPEELGLHLRLDFIAQKNLMDTDYFRELIQTKRFKWLFVHDGDGFTEEDGPATFDYRCSDIDSIQKNLRIINKHTYLLVSEQTRGKLFIQKWACDEDEEEEETTSTTTTTTTTQPTTVGEVKSEGSAVTNPTTERTTTADITSSKRPRSRQTPPTLPTTTTEKPPSRFTLENGTLEFPTVAKGHRLIPLMTIALIVTTTIAVVLLKRFEF